VGIIFNEELGIQKKILKIIDLFAEYFNLYNKNLEKKKFLEKKKKKVKKLFSHFKKKKNF